MLYYPNQPQILVAVDCIIFGFDGENLKLLLVKRNIEPESNTWSLMGGFLNPHETTDEAAIRVLRERTGLEGVYMEQLQVFSDPNRDPGGRTISVLYFALIDIHQYEPVLSHEFHAEWFLLTKKPRLVFDHDDMVRLAQKYIRYKAAMHPILFQLLPNRFTIPQLQSLYECIYQTVFDSRNFTRKILSTGLLVKQKEKDKSGSKKGAYYYKLDKRKFRAGGEVFLQLVPKSKRDLMVYTANPF